MCGTHFSRSTVSELCSRLDPVVEAWSHRPLKENRFPFLVVDAMVLKVRKDFESRAPAAIEILENGLEDATAVFSLHPKYRRRLRTTSGLERLDEEVTRRERVIRIFPNRQSVVRLLGALLTEHYEQWPTGKRYLYMSEYYETSKVKPVSDSKVILMRQVL